MSTPAPFTKRVFAGGIIYIALEASGTSDSVTKPAANSPLWLKLDICESWSHKPKTQSEIADVCGEHGWEEEEEIYTLADLYEIKLGSIPALYYQLQFGLAATIVPGTAQTPAVKSNRKVNCWMKIQMRQADGTDRIVFDQWGVLRAGEPPAAEKKEQKAILLFAGRRSTLNAFDLPAA